MSKNIVCKTPRWQLFKASLNNLDAHSFKKKLEADNVLVIDVRTEEEYQTSCIPTALCINYLGDDFWEKIEALDKSKDILIYCRSGRRSIRVGTLMKNGGFDPSKLFNLNGGILEWMEEGMEIEGLKE